MQLFLGENAFEKRPTLEKGFIDAVLKYPRSNLLLFGSKSGKKPEPVLVKKMTMMLLAAKILKYSAVRKEGAVATSSDITIYAALSFVAADESRLAVNDDSYWEMIPTREAPL